MNLFKKLEMNLGLKKQIKQQNVHQTIVQREKEEMIENPANDPKVREVYLK